ncbi:Endothelin-converting enzyme/putative endopeptidase [Sphingomonas antarctica]|uniref:M13 family metallopeptidase n=1 Tax=Sphingomonas antarctica TaxID=2040274 RepID=UPI0039E981FB
MTKSFRAALLIGALTLPAALSAQSAAPTKPQLGTWGVDLTGRDIAEKPGDDFWDYANGAWAKTAVIPADQTVTGSFQDLALLSERQVRDIVGGLGAPAAGTKEAKIADLWASWMDTATIEQRGTAVLKPYLDPVAAVKDRAGLIALFATPSYTAPAGVGVAADPDDPTRYTVGVAQGGLGLPNRDYYLRADGKFPAFRAAYRTYVSTMLGLAGFSTPDARADRVIALETQIANAHWTPERSRDVTQSVNRLTIPELQALAPQYDWARYIAARGLGTPARIVVRQPSELTDTSKLLDSVPLSTWKDYLAFHFIRTHATQLPKAFDDANFNFYSVTLRDVKEQRERWKRGVAVVNAQLPEAVGEVYVAKYFPPASKAQMDELISNIRASLKDRIAQNNWMDPATRAQADAKLAAFTPQIGYPDKWIDYSTYVVKRDDLLGNTVRGERFTWNLQLQRFPKPVDKSLWFMSPQTVNAYYNPPNNSITFPAAILQPPFFDPNADPAVNYGAIGAVIGHEIGHGFDDQGRRFNGLGQLKDWWSEDAAAKYGQRTTMLGAQYDAIEPIPGIHINGKLTMGENIGDLSGVETAYGAWRKYVAAHGEPPVIDGLTGDQRFFLGYAQVWRGMRREGAVREQLLTDPHSPEKARVNAVVRNIDAWYKAFSVKPGEALYLAPEQRVHIW